LCEERCRGLRVSILDTDLHADAIHRGEGQMIPAVRRLYNACEFTCEPRLQEPIFLTEIYVPNDEAGSVYNCLSKRRGEVIEEEAIHGLPTTIIKCYLPVAESFGFTEHLREMT